MWPLTGKEIYNSIVKEVQDNKPFDHLVFEGLSIDSRKIKPHYFFVAIKGEKFDGHSFLFDCFEKGIQLALVDKNSIYLNSLSKENRNKCIEVDSVVDKLRDFAKFMRLRLNFPVIAVAGSNGKTTTKEFIYYLLSGENYKVTKTEKSENGFIGMALTICQENHNYNSPTNALVLEIGIDDIGAMTQHVSLGMPNISLITALGPEHLEHLINWETAVSEELIIFKNPNTKRIWQFYDEKIFQFFNDLCESENINNLNLKDDFIVIEKSKFKELNNNSDNMLKSISKIIIWEIVNYTSFNSDVIFEIYPKQNNFELLNNMIFKVPLPGIHNAANFALAFSTAIMLERNPQEILFGLKKFVPLPMRSHITKLKNGAILFDDSYNSSPMSLEAALQSLENNEWKNKTKLIVLGDMLDLGTESKYWHEKFFYSLKNLQNSYLCLYGSAMYDCYKNLKETEDFLITFNKTRIFWLSADQEPINFLNVINKDLSDFVILIKGSRGMRLDRLVKSIEEKYC